MDNDFAMAMDGYTAACQAEERAMKRYFLLPDLANHMTFLQASHIRRQMLKILLERHADFLVHIIDDFRGSIGKEIDALDERLILIEALLASLQHETGSGHAEQSIERST